MNIFELKEPSVVINEAIDIIDELVCNATKILSKVTEMHPEEREKLGLNYIISTRLNLNNNYTLIEDLERVRDFASEQYIRIIEEAEKEAEPIPVGVSYGNFEF